MEDLTIMIVGGDFNTQGGRPSGVVAKLAENLGCAGKSYNGGTLDELRKFAETAAEYDVIVWMPEVGNEEDKIYPRKATGATLICSKVLRSGYGPKDILSRIYAMRANAIIVVDARDRKNCQFNLVDALGNSWNPGGKPVVSIPELGSAILKFDTWSRGQVRWPSVQVESPGGTPICEVEPKFISLVHYLARSYEDVVGRWYGNASSRCFFMFPSKRCVDEEHPYTTPIAVSLRNTNKKEIATNDFVVVRLGDGYRRLEYFGDQKPSVDAAAQALIYGEPKFGHINYMIHGHAYVENAPYTEHYFPCGDMRESADIANVMKGNQYGIMNLRNHGCLYYADSIENLRFLVGSSRFVVRGGPGIQFETIPEDALQSEEEKK